MKRKITIRLLAVIFIIFFGLALFYPMLVAFMRAFIADGQLSLDHFRAVFDKMPIGEVFMNSCLVALAAACLSVFLAVNLAYAINYTRMNKQLKKLSAIVVMVPMLLPTITYGFAIIYSIGNQGMVTRLFGVDAPNFYGFSGLMLGYTIYTLPVTYLMVNNAMKYIDSKYILVSRLMGDNKLKTLWITLLVPLIPSAISAFIQAFFMSFTDYGIPSYIGGNYEVIATTLYNQMLGTIPNFNHGAVTAIFMLLPAILSMILLYFLGRDDIAYESVQKIEVEKNTPRDAFFSCYSVLLMLFILVIFVPIFIVPFTQSWPYNMGFTLDHLASAFKDSGVMRSYRNSIMISAIVAVLGTLLAYLAAVATVRSNLNKGIKNVINVLSIISNTIPGMVLGLAMLLAINGTFLKGSFIILIVANIVHYFSTPYLTLKNTLAKLSRSWETSAALMGDTFLDTIARIITPNILSSLWEVVSYYFINSMVTVSAVILLYSTRTILITTKIKELQYYNNFNEVFILSIMLFLTNVLARVVFNYLSERKKAKGGNAA
ncbi:ABC transporter permease subunit [Peptococcus simiae]|uniref:ABC transporter permease subunit n=1 Tax=Peptococcus simiae TaxID=1643805 RepID=UPI00397FA52F